MATERLRNVYVAAPALRYSTETTQVKGSGGTLLTPGLGTIEKRFPACADTADRRASARSPARVLLATPVAPSIPPHRASRECSTAIVSSTEVSQRIQGGNDGRTMVPRDVVQVLGAESRTTRLISERPTLPPDMCGPSPILPSLSARIRWALSSTAEDCSQAYSSRGADVHVCLSPVRSSLPTPTSSASRILN